LFRRKWQCCTERQKRTRCGNRFHDLVVVFNVFFGTAAGHGLGNGRPRHFEAGRFHSNDNSTGFVPVCQLNLCAPRERGNAPIRIDPQCIGANGQTLCGTSTTIHEDSGSESRKVCHEARMFWMEVFQHDSFVIA
jgi:hypothetical protein